MKIGVDVRPLQGETQFRGIGKALGRVLVPLSKIAKANSDSMIFFYDPALDKPNVNLFVEPKYVAVKTPKTFKKKYIRVVVRPYKKLTVKKGVADVTLQFDFALGIPKNTAAVTAFHDLIPILFRSNELQNSTNQAGLKKLKQALGGSLQWKRYNKDLETFKRSNKIIAISQSSKNDLLNFYPELNPDNVVVTHLGVDAKNLGVKNSNHTDSSVESLLNSRYILYVGGIDVRKNIVQLVRDFYILKDKHPVLKLVVVGKEFSLKSNLTQLGWYKALDKNKSYANDVLSLGYVSDYDLEQLYRNAACFVFPSLYEGFGLPILEAMAYGCPTVAYKNSSIVEIAGDSSVLVENGRNMSEAIDMIIENPKLRNSIKAKGYEQVKKFSWDSTATKIYKVLTEASHNES